MKDVDRGLPGERRVKQVMRRTDDVADCDVRELELHRFEAARQHYLEPLLFIVWVQHVAFTRAMIAAMRPASATLNKSAVSAALQKREREGMNGFFMSKPPLLFGVAASSAAAHSSHAAEEIGADRRAGNGSATGSGPLYREQRRLPALLPR